MNFKGSESVLDVGCGDGKVTAEIARTVSSGRVVGVDQSREFISYASCHYPKSAFPSLEFRQMDARALDVGGEFDLIFSNATLHWVDDHKAFLSGASKHLRESGRLILSCGGGGREASGVIPSVEHTISTSKWSPYFEGFAFPYYFHFSSDYESWLPSHDFSPVRCEMVDKDMSHDSREALTGWIRTTWLPYTQRIPDALREQFIEDLVSTYLASHPADKDGRTHVRMVRLEVEALKLK